MTCRGFKRRTTRPRGGFDHRFGGHRNQSGCIITPHAGKKTINLLQALPHAPAAEAFRNVQHKDRLDPVRRSRNPRSGRSQCQEDDPGKAQGGDTPPGRQAAGRHQHIGSRKQEQQQPGPGKGHREVLQ
jgi:hypothetical protein